MLDFLKKRKSVEEKKQLIRKFIYSSYEQEQLSNGLDIPFFLKAEKWLKENIKSLSDVNYYYDLIKIKEDKNYVI